MTVSEARHTKRVCYFSYLASASVFSLPPVLFATFKEMYGVSYTLLGTLVLINFFTQLAIDLIFSFFSKHFNIPKTICATPLLTALGLAIYALIPAFFPQYAYIGFVIGTVVFSVASGLGEVLLSPTVAALPSDTPDKDMSTLHSLYGYGVVGVVIISTLFIKIFGAQNWMYLTLILALFPVITSVMFFTSKLPDFDMHQQSATKGHSCHKAKSIALLAACIFLGACSETVMTNWISTYAETALNISKVWGDIFGMALFAAVLALTRTAYAKYGKNISRTLMVGMAGASVCYITAAIVPNTVISLVSCVAVGLFTAMLWPGTLILMEEKVKGVGVAAYALMAAGGDLGASLAPQGLGIAVDSVSAAGWAKQLGDKFSLSAEQIGFKIGMLLASVFSLLGIILLIYMKKHFEKCE